MVGCLFFSGVNGDPLGLRALGKVLVIFFSVLLGVLFWYAGGVAAAGWF